MLRYHTHIYFEPDDLDRAHVLSQLARATKLFSFAKVSARPVGPHPTGMIELHFDALMEGDAIRWLDAHRDQRSVLVHEDTGDDVQDHTQGARWLGAKLDLDFTFFETIKSRPELRIHKVSGS